MDASILTALIVAVPTVLANTFMPLCYLFMVNRARRIERREDYARQDTVSRLLLESNNITAENTAVTNTKLDSIHSLVNSNMTAVLQSEMGATAREAAAIRELIKMKSLLGHEPTHEASTALKTADNRILELAAVLNSRLAPDNSKKEVES